MTNLINLTPHALRIRIEESNEAIPLDSDIVIAPTLPSARVRTSLETVEYINGIPVKRNAFAEIENLPEQQEGAIVYITSTLVAQRAGRADVVSPNTAPKEDIRYPAEHKLAGLTFAVRGFQVF